MKWFVKGTLIASLLAALAIGSMGLSGADEIAQVGRDLAARNQNALVTLQIVSKMRSSYMGEEESREVKQEVTGFIVDPSGLIVTSLSGTSVADIAARMMGGDSDSPKFTSDITGIKIIRMDGSELTGKLVLRDKDLDLAFIRPTAKPAQPMPSLDLSKTTKPGILDQILVLNRLGTIGNRAMTVTIDRIDAVVEKPRTFYVPAGQSNLGLGGAAFTLDGNVIGLLLLRVAPKGINSSLVEMSGSGISGILGVILPASDIADAAKQAPENAVATEPTPAPAKPKAAEPKKPVATPKKSGGK